MRIFINPIDFLPAEAEVIEINPVEVTATRMEQKLSNAIPAISVITKEEIVRSNAGDISELLAGHAGIEFARNGGIGAPISIYMRGSGSTQTMVLVDGIPFSSQDATGGSSPIYMIPLNQIDRVEIMRGNAAAVYGSGAMGGVINLITSSKDVRGLIPQRVSLMVVTTQLERVQGLMVEMMIFVTVFQLLTIRVRALRLFRHPNTPVHRMDTAVIRAVSIQVPMDINKIV